MPGLIQLFPHLYFLHFHLQMILRWVEQKDKDRCSTLTVISKNENGRHRFPLSLPEYTLTTLEI